MRSDINASRPEHELTQPDVIYHGGKLMGTNGPFKVKIDIPANALSDVP